MKQVMDAEVAASATLNTINYTGISNDEQLDEYLSNGFGGPICNKSINPGGGGGLAGPGPRPQPPRIELLLSARVFLVRKRQKRSANSTAPTPPI
jgi:hypothetical protein